MTSADLLAALDAMTKAAGDDAYRLPGLIEINSSEWCAGLAEIEHTAKTLDKGARIDGVRVAISSEFTTRVLARAEAGERGGAL